MMFNLKGVPEPEKAPAGAFFVTVLNHKKRPPERYSEKYFPDGQIPSEPILRPILQDASGGGFESVTRPNTPEGALKLEGVHKENQPELTDPINVILRPR